jgi:GT2 family glycosyltransferase
LKDTAVVILNYNGAGFLEQFLPNVIKNSPEADVIVIDNASSDHSLGFLRDNFPQIQVICNKDNYGFAGGYNYGLAQISYENFVLLNSDVEVTHNWLVPILKRAAENPNLAAIQPKILDFNKRDHFEYAGAAGGFLDKFGYAFCKGRVFDTLERDLNQYQQPTDIFWATGACFFVKSKVFKDLGGFDERFFAHMEEIDLCWRIHNAAFSIQYEPNSVVFHVGGGTLNKANPFKTYLNFRNNLAMLYKNLPKHKLFPIIFARLILDGISSLKFLKDGNVKDFFAVAKAHFSFYGMLPYLTKKRNGSYGGYQKLSNFSIVWRYFAKKQKTYPEICSQ